jgi:hypothetical protein
MSQTKQKTDSALKDVGKQGDGIRSDGIRKTRARGAGHDGRATRAEYNQLPLMGTVSPVHWILVAIILLALFGPKTLTKVGKTAGRSVRAVSDVKKDLANVPNQVLADLPPAPRSKPPS